MEDEELDWPAEPPPLQAGKDARRAFRRGVLVGCGASLAGLLALGVAAVVVLGFLSETGSIPSTANVPGHDLSEAVLESLREWDVLDPDERVLYYYSDAVLDFRDDGNFFTDRRIVSYWTEGRKFRVEQAGYPEVASIDPQPVDSAWETSEVWIERQDGSSFLLCVSGEDDGDEGFVDLLMETWRERR